MIEIIPNWHPIWVHFAVALLLTASGLFLLFGWKKDSHGNASNALIVARWTLRLGVAAAAGALLTGHWASGTVVHDDLAHSNMMVHRTWAFAAAAAFALAAVIDYLRRPRSSSSVLTNLLVLAGSVALAITGLEGAENVYEHGLGVQRLPVVSSHEHSAEGHGPGHEQPMETRERGKTGHESHEEEHDSQEAGHESVDSEHDSIKAHSHTHATTQTEKLPSAEEVFSDHPAAQVAAKLHQAISAGDVETLRTLIAPEVLIFESGGVEASLAEYEGHHMPADMAFMKGMKPELLLQQIFEAGGFVVVVTQFRIQGVVKEQNIDLSSTETLLMKNIDGQWQIVHIHWSSG